MENGLKAVYIVRGSGEIYLKSKPVRREMLHLLEENIMNSFTMNRTEMKIYTDHAHIYVESADDMAARAILSKTFGVSSFSHAWKITSVKNEILEAILSVAERYIKEGSSFGISTKRTGTHPFSSRDISAEGGDLILQRLKHRDIHVDLDSPDVMISVEVREKSAFVWIEKIIGPGGMPCGSQGEGIAVIDSMESAVSAWLMMKRGVKTSAVAAANSVKYAETLQRWQHDLEIITADGEDPYRKAIEVAKIKKASAISAHLDIETLKKYPAIFTDFGFFSPTIAMQLEEIERLFGYISS